MSDYSDIFLAMGLSATILEKAEKQSKSKKLSTIPPSNMQPSERERFLEENKDVLIATAIKYTNGEYTVAKDDHLLNVAMQTSLDKGTQRKTTENELPSLTQCTA